MDNVNHPKHYIQRDFECIDILRSLLGKQGFESYCRGNCLKYLWRYEDKGGIEDLKKCRWYLNELISSMENKTEGTNKIESKKDINFYVPMIGKDGCIIEKNKTYLGQDGISWIILGFTDSVNYPVRGWNCDKGERWLRPEWLSQGVVTAISSSDIINVNSNSNSIYNPITIKKPEDDYGYTTFV